MIFDGDTFADWTGDAVSAVFTGVTGSDVFGSSLNKVSINSDNFPSPNEASSGLKTG